jgi:NAD(P)-dependent dehydrogenase (short-subunit alcohol dehydrogenase family)
MRVFLTGASGYIGGSVAQRLIELGHEVFGLVRSEPKAQQIQQLGMQPVIGTLGDAAVLAAAAHVADAVIHAASSDDRASVETLLAALEGSASSLSMSADQASSQTRRWVNMPIPLRSPKTPALSLFPTVSTAWRSMIWSEPQASAAEFGPSSSAHR